MSEIIGGVNYPEEYFSFLKREYNKKSKFFQDRISNVLEMVGEVNNKKVLDIGCGSGELLKTASKKGIKDLFGIDISEEALKLAKKNVPIASLINGKGEKLEFGDNAFDNITCLGVLEHLLDIEKGLQEIARVAKINSKICIMVPNRKFIGWIIKQEEYKGTEQKEICESLYTLKEWSKLINDNGLKIIKVIPDRGFIYNKEYLRRKSFKYFAKKILLFLTYFLPIKYTYQFIFICTKDLTAASRKDFVPNSEREGKDWERREKDGGREV